MVSSGSNDTFVAKLDSSGNTTWLKTIGGTGNDLIQGLDVDSSGNVYVAGYFNSTASVLGQSLTSSGSNDIFVAKLDSSGNTTWLKQA
ncbi:MAG: SBBP repeat-containing protein [Candidatus Peribacteria bacterium]|nr:MAG: SBBP repeat-containing protein [Candidatus Peribacteria bacterium]